jgi:hypothetical protein
MSEDKVREADFHREKIAIKYLEQYGIDNRSDLGKHAINAVIVGYGIGNQQGRQSMKDECVALLEQLSRAWPDDVEVLIDVAKLIKELK